MTLLTATDAWRWPYSVSTRSVPGSFGKIPSRPWTTSLRRTRRHRKWVRFFERHWQPPASRVRMEIPEISRKQSSTLNNTGMVFDRHQHIAGFVRQKSREAKTAAKKRPARPKPEAIGIKRQRLSEKIGVFPHTGKHRHSMPTPCNALPTGSAPHRYSRCCNFLLY